MTRRITGKVYVSPSNPKRGTKLTFETRAKGIVHNQETALNFARALEKSTRCIVLGVVWTSGKVVIKYRVRRFGKWRKSRKLAITK